MTLSTTIDDLPEFSPRPFRPWWKILFVALGLVALGLFVVFLAIVLPGCGSDQTVKTWPEVVERHWFATGCLIAWAIFLGALVVGNIRIRLGDGEEMKP